MSAQVDWQLLRAFAAVARTGSLSGAAVELGVHHSTVSRQMVALEGVMRARLLERQARGVVLTAAGEALMTHTSAMEEHSFAAVRAVAGRDVELEGDVRFTTTDELLGLVLPLLRSFLEAYPGITLHIDTASALRDLTRREADVALRAGRRPPDDSIARHMGTIRWAVFAREDSGPAWIDSRSAYTGQLPGPDAGRTVVRAHSVQAAVQAIRAGLGRGPLPVVVGMADPSLVELSPIDEAEPGQLWLLLHPDLRRTARVRALVTHLEAGLTSPPLSIVQP